MNYPQASIGKIYINPNFASSTVSSHANNIHINPNFSNHANSHLPIVQKNDDSNMICYVNPKMFSQLPTQTLLNQQFLDKNSTDYVVHSKTKIVKNTTHTLEKSAASTEINKPTTNVPRKPSYTLVRNNPPRNSSIVKCKTNTAILKTNPFSKTNKHIVNRTKCTTSTPTKLIVKEKTNTKPIHVHTTTDSLSRHITIEGEKFICSRGKLVKSKHSSNWNKCKLVKKVVGNGGTPGRKSSFTAENINPKSFKKNNMVCSKYVKTGICKKQKAGKCDLLHDPKNVSVCKLFLKGMCKISGCNLSHSVTLEKMPTCKFFLEGCCTRDSCPYLHVNVGKDVKICAQFIKGFCPQGKECQLKHLNVCPKFYEFSKCDDKNCKLPHSIFNSSKLQIPSYTTTTANTTRPKLKKEIPLPVMSHVAEQDHTKSSRYFEDNDVNSNRKTNETENDDKKKYDLSKRPKIGDLPSFIALD